MKSRRGVIFLVMLLVFVGFLAGCGSKDPTISDEEQEKTREHKHEYEDRSNF